MLSELALKTTINDHAILDPSVTGKAGLRRAPCPRPLPPPIFLNISFLGPVWSGFEVRRRLRRDHCVPIRARAGKNGKPEMQSLFQVTAFGAGNPMKI